MGSIRVLVVRCYSHLHPRRYRVEVSKYIVLGSWICRRGGRLKAAYIGIYYYALNEHKQSILKFWLMVNTLPLVLCRNLRTRRSSIRLHEQRLILCFVILGYPRWPRLLHIGLFMALVIFSSGNCTQDFKGSERMLKLLFMRGRAVLHVLRDCCRLKRASKAISNLPIF